MRRYELSDFEWGVIEPHLPNKVRGVPRLMTAMFSTASCGVSGSDRPGPTFRTAMVPILCYNRFARWRKAGVGIGCWRRFPRPSTAKSS